MGDAFAQHGYRRGLADPEAMREGRRCPWIARWWYYSLFKSRYNYSMVFGTCASFVLQYPYLGPARNAELLEIVTIVRDDDTELAIHAMKMRDKYQELLPGG